MTVQIGDIFQYLQHEEGRSSEYCLITEYNDALSEPHWDMIGLDTGSQTCEVEVILLDPTVYRRLA